MDRTAVRVAGLFALTVLVTLQACTQAPPAAGDLHADAGSDRSVVVGQTVTVDPSASTGAIDRYRWTLKYVPSGSAASLQGLERGKVSFVADVPGSYGLELTVSAGTRSDSDSVTITAVAAGASLTPGGVVTGPDGVRVGAVPGALGAAVDVHILTEDPAALPPLEGARLVGAPYRMSAEPTVLAPVGAPLVVGLPLPAGVDPAGLELAVLTPVIGHVVVPGETAPDFVWDTTEATYDAATGMMLAPLYSFSTWPEGIVVALADPGVTTGKVAAAGLATQAEKVGHFAAKCGIRFAAGECTAQEEHDAAAIADAFFGDVVTGLGFKAPIIRPLVADIKLTLVPPTFHASVTVASHLLDLRPEGTTGCKKFNGRFVLPLLKAYVCLPRSPGNDVQQPPHPGDIRHEIFHAIQYAYSASDTLSLQRNLYWPVVEGGANAAEGSLAAMTRNTFGMTHPVDVPLSRPGSSKPDDDGYDYGAQDFWVFVGLRKNRGLDYFQVLYQGLTFSTIGVDTQFRKLFGDGYGLGEAYWDWVKNEAFESSVTGGDLPVNDACVLNRSQIVEASLPKLSFSPQSGVVQRENLTTTLEPLQSRVIAINLRDDGVNALATIEATVRDANVRVKFYPDVSSATNACQGQSDGTTTTAPIAAGAGDTTVYLLVSNLNLTDTVRLFGQDSDLAVHSQPVGVTITSPADGATVAEGEVAFQAQMDNPMGGLPSYRWAVDGADAGTTTPTFRKRLCPGDHTVEVDARTAGPTGSITVHDAITVSVQNREPVAEIVSVPASIPAGTDVRLEGRVTDPTCNDPGGTRVDVEHMLWSLEDGYGGAGAAIASSFGSQGSKTVTLSYTDADGLTGSASTVVTVTAPVAGSDPVVAIKAPPPDAFYAYDTVVSGQYDVDVEGYVTASVDDADVVWSTREVGTSTWRELARGRTAVLQLPVMDSDTPYDLRLSIDGVPPSDRTVQVTHITTQGVIQ